MANKKFSEFELKTSTSDVSHVVGYNGAENVQITPANFVTTGGTGVFLPLAGGTMTGTNGVVFPDNFYLNLGTSSDFEIYHDGNNSYLKDQGTGELILASNGTGIKLEKTSGEKMIHALTDGAVELYYDSALKFATTSTGIDVTGDVTTSGTNATVFADRFSGISTGVVLGTTGAGTVFLRPSGVGLTDFQSSFSTTLATIGTNATFTGNVTTSTSTTADNVFSVINNTAGYASIIQMIANNDGGAIYNHISSNTGGGSQHWKISGGAAVNTMAFYTNSSERMRLDSSGNLGLGVSNPLSKLSVGENATSTLKPTVAIADTSNGASLTLRGQSPILCFDATAGGVPKILMDGQGLEFKTGTLDTQGDVRLKIDSSGNVGIGTSSPQNLLHLGDNTNSTAGTLRIDSFVASQFWKLEPGTNTLNIKDYNGTSILSFNGETNASNFDGDVLLKGSNNPYTSANRGNITLNGSAGNIIAFTNNTQAKGYIYHDLNDLNIVNEIAGNLTFSTAGTERMRLDASGNLLIGATSTSSATGSWFEVAGAGRRILNLANDSTGGATVQRFINGNGTVGSIVTNASATAFNTSSDYRLKEDLQDFEGLDLVSKIPVYDYKWKADESRSYGVMAHELAEVLPQAVSGDKDAEEMQSVDYSKIVPLLVKSIQELKAEIELLKNK